MRVHVTPMVSALLITASIAACGSKRATGRANSSNGDLSASEASPVGISHLTSAVVLSEALTPAPHVKRPLQGVSIAFLATDGVEQVELTEPRHDLEVAGAETVLVSPRAGTIQAMNRAEKGALLQVDMTLANADASRFSGLVLPGGVANPDALRVDPLAIAFVRAFVNRGKPIAAICHGPWLLIEAGAVRGKYMTSWPSLKTDLLNAGANWMDQAVVDDSGLVTSRNPEDIPEFSKRAIEEFGKI